MKRAILVLAGALAFTGAAPIVTMAADTVVITSPVDAQKLIGQSVKNFDNETIGKIDSVLLDTGGKVVAVVVGVGGFLGLGERDVALDWSSLRVTDGGRDVRANFTKDQLKALPEYKFADAKQRNTAYYDRYYKPASASGYSSGSPFGPAGEVRLSKLMQADVYNTAGEKIGDITEILLSPKHELAAIIAVGGFLGMGEHNVGVDLKKLRLERRGDAEDFRFVFNASKEQLKALPAYRYDNPHSLILR
jgi:sporulation protein YlmC with PRC-barrel domain